MEDYKIKNILISASSIFLTLSALISLWLVGHVILKGSIDFLIAILLIVSACLILTTIGVNVPLIRNPDSLTERKANFNIIISVLQSLSILVDGFNYRYVQGFEWGVFFHLNHNTNKTIFNTFFSTFIFEGVFNFKSNDGFTIGINFIAVFLVILYVFLRKGLVRGKNK